MPRARRWSQSATNSKQRLPNSKLTRKLDFLAEMGMSEPGLDRVIRAGYKLLGLQTFFTAGPKEVRAWTVRQSASAPQAGVIHTDFEKGFIRAEVVGYDDFIDLGGEPGAKEAANGVSKAKSTRLLTET